jgi:dipeptidyl aminopeptidase/acylaminoacyl peptidase
MITQKLTAFLALAALFMAPGGASGTNTADVMPRLIPLTDFFRNPETAGFTISPDGEHIAFMKPWEKRMNVYVRKVGERAETRLTGARERDIAGYAWANNHRILYVQDTGGDENYRLYAIDVDGSGYKELTPFEGVRAGIVDALEDNDAEMLISLNRLDSKVFDVYRINITTGALALVAENPGNVSEWLADNDGRLRVAVTTDGVQSSLLYRESEKDPFRTVATTDFKNTLDPLFFTFDNQKLYVASNLGRDKTAIYLYDVSAGRLLDLVFEHPEVDVSGLLRSKARKAITGVAFTTDKPHYRFFDPERRQLQEALEARLPGRRVAVTGMSRDERRVIVRTFSDKYLGACYLYEPSSGRLEKLAELSPWLNEAQMADVQPIRFTSRDGLTLHGYLTLPKGVTPANRPIVVNPHGGPWARDVWGFDPETQFLANRGVGVLQINFRGSTGYGKAFWEAGFKQWGGKMQDDISDGVQWLIRQGIADPKRIGIYGASYGGYAALAGLAFTPELYACGIDYVGVSNIFTLLETLPPYWELGRRMMYEMIGDPVKDEALLKQVSPVFHAARIRAPLLVAQGANDPRVKKAESDQIVQALRQRGVAVEYIVKENEGHGFRNEENRFEFYRRVEGFLARHLGSRAESLPPA